MVKEIMIGEKKIALSNNLSWAMIYKDQFGHDIVPDIMPVMSAVVRLLGVLDDGGLDLKTVDPDALQDALVELCALQFVDFIHLIWALAKANDDNIDLPNKWVSQFDEFPLDIIVPEVLELLGKGLVSSKNWERLLTMKASK